MTQDTDFFVSFSLLILVARRTDTSNHDGCLQSSYLLVKISFSELESELYEACSLRVLRKHDKPFYADVAPQKHIPRLLMQI